MKRIAALMVGGGLTSTVMEPMVYAAIYAIWKWQWEVKPVSASWLNPLVILAESGLMTRE